MDNQDLKPCPFCGDVKPYVISGMGDGVTVIRCSTCTARVVGFGFNGVKDSWNARTAKQITDDEMQKIFSRTESSGGIITVNQALEFGRALLEQMGGNQRRSNVQSD